MTNKEIISMLTAMQAEIKAESVYNSNGYITTNKVMVDMDVIESIITNKINSLIDTQKEK